MCVHFDVLGGIGIIWGKVVRYKCILFGVGYGPVARQT